MPDVRDEQVRPLIWRGPFKVKRSGHAWKIVNRYGEAERLGYRSKASASHECMVMNLAHEFCDPTQEKR
jgi:hypothetical protein